MSLPPWLLYNFSAEEEGVEGMGPIYWRGGGRGGGRAGRPARMPMGGGGGGGGEGEGQAKVKKPV